MNAADQAQLERIISRGLNGSGLITVLTGAGVSAESGIPTFRGPEGYWTIGSRNYQPHEIATSAMLRQNPREVWTWYLYRHGICRAAQPNPGHLAIAEMENILGDGFRLLTQNVDGLHLRAGNSPDRTFQVHGNLNVMRCSADCSPATYPIPEAIPTKDRSSQLTDAEMALLTCPACGAQARPHVLLWDESYDEMFYRFESSMRVARNTSLLIVVGTEGATNLPNQVAATVLDAGNPLIDINIHSNLFSRAAQGSPGGMACRQASARVLPVMATIIRGLAVRKGD